MRNELGELGIRSVSVLETLVCRVLSLTLCCIVVILRVGRRPALLFCSVVFVRKCVHNRVWVGLGIFFIPHGKGEHPNPWPSPPRSVDGIPVQGSAEFATGSRQCWFLTTDRSATASVISREVRQVGVGRSRRDLANCCCFCSGDERKRNKSIGGSVNKMPTRLERKIERESKVNLQMIEDVLVRRQHGLRRLLALILAKVTRSFLQYKHRIQYLG